MKLIVGLGNPGNKYKNTRHNAGWLLVDGLAKLNLPGVELFKPQK
ncbi:aminoacyl-tRNA hydrolase, partial [Candidatus Beckwithbacteria bacterium CG23_combo_of_CG06-09_8_20_14_all_47_9]